MGRWSRSRRSGRHLERADQTIGFGQELFHFLKAGAARHAGPEVQLDLTDFLEIQLAIEQRVKRTFIKMRHSSPVLQNDRLRLTAGGRGPG